VIEIAQRNLVTIYGLSTVAFGFFREGDANMVRLTQETGGRVAYPLEGLYSDISGYLSNPTDEGNYAIQPGTGGYTAELANGMFNAIANVVGISRPSTSCATSPPRTTLRSGSERSRCRCRPCRMCTCVTGRGTTLTLRKEAGRSGKSAIKLWKLASDELS